MNESIPKNLLLIAESPEKEGALDDLVHDCFSNMASDVNNGGPEAQITCLRENGFSWKYILEALGVDMSVLEIVVKKKALKGGDLCPHCKMKCLVHIPAREPHYAEYLTCPSCDKTFRLEGETDKEESNE